MIKLIEDFARTILKDEINNYKNKIHALTYLYNQLESKISHEEYLTRVEKNWNNKWPKANITYKTQDNYKQDVRTLITTKSYILEPLISKYKDLSYDEKALALLKYVHSKINYVSDKGEYWQMPEITWQCKAGDCEDGALLLASLMIMAEIPSYRVKVCAGWVANNDKLEGHAYVIYLADDGEWYVLDWCYWYSDSVKVFKKIPHKNIVVYDEIWWTFNDKYSWAQKNTVVDLK